MGRSSALNVYDTPFSGGKCDWRSTVNTSRNVVGTALVAMWMLALVGISMSAVVSQVLR